MIRGSFRPDNEGVILRGYVRQRGRLFESASQHVQLMHKALTQMNLQINHVLSDITGATGMKIIRAIVGGERDSTVLAFYRDGRCKKSREMIAKALNGNYREEHLLSLKHGLEAYDFFHNQILECEKCIKKLIDLNQIDSSSANDMTLESLLAKDSKKKVHRKRFIIGAPTHSTYEPL